jgi:beta-aspartyl-peptidase (threonine type)
MTLPVVVVHGGATSFEVKYHDAIIEAVRVAAQTGICVLEKGGSSLDAAEAAVWKLEETNLFTAGRGAKPNSEGDIELDAMIMDGTRLQSGAVMAVRGVIHPVSLARYVLERTSNSQFVAGGAEKLYKKMIAEGYRKVSKGGATQPSAIAQGCDTVGCVVVDSRGHIAAASSTSGWSGKLPGRIGDSPIIGAGVYANDLAAASCTGRGEQILRIVMARMAVHYVEDGLGVTDAAAKIMTVLRERTTGEAGLIMVDSQGNVAMGHDTPHMPVAIASSSTGTIYSSMRPEWPSRKNPT